MAQSVISKLLAMIPEYGDFIRHCIIGRLPITISKDDQHLAVTVKRSRQSITLDLFRQLPVFQRILSCHLSSARVYQFQSETVYRLQNTIVKCLSDAFHSQKSVVSSDQPAVENMHSHRGRVMSSDKYRFGLQSKSRRTFLQRIFGTLYHQEINTECYCYGGEGLFV